MMDISRDRLYVYDLDDTLVDSLKLVEFDEDVDTGYILPPKSVAKQDDLTKFNRQRETQGLVPLTEEQFDNMVETGSIGSISGSEDEEEDMEDELYERFSETTIEDDLNSDSPKTGHLKSKTPMIYFKSSKLPEDKNFGVYKALFNEKEIQDPIMALKAWNIDENTGKSALFMMGGGHFAGAIISHKRKNIKGNAVNHKISLQEQQVEVIKSKTFHRYTTRKKQGGSQSANDNAKGNAKSVGANIRRQMEQLLESEVRELLELWKEDLKECDSIYIRAGGSGRKTLIGYEGAVLKNDDKRIKGFPFSTRRATASELKRAWAQLTYLTVSDVIKQDEKQKQRILQQQENLRKSQQQQKKQSANKEVSESEKHTGELIGFCKRQKAPLLINYLKKHQLSVDMELSPSETYISTPTLLHYCSSQGLAHMVQVLMVNLKADATITNKAGRVAAELSANKHTKSIFQICRSKLGEDYCDWALTKIGEAKTKEEVEREEQQEAERIRQEKQQQIQEGLKHKTEMELKKPAFSSKGQVGGSKLLSSTSGLSDEQKMRLMREQRARAAEARLNRK